MGSAQQHEKIHCYAFTKKDRTATSAAFVTVLH